MNEVEISLVRIYKITPSPKNDKLYRPVDPADPDVIALAASIAEHGVLEPLVLTQDLVILSGHRRFAAATLAGLVEVPCRIEDIHSTDPNSLTRIREYNRQREKSADEKLREEIVSANPEEAYRALVEHRQEKARIKVDFFKIEGKKKTRAEISPAKQPMLRAIEKVIEDMEDFWPLSDRQIHYRLLNDPPLIHASKPGSTYVNDKKSYDKLVELLTRARLEDIIDMEVIADATRPVTIWDVHQSATPFIRRELDDFLKGYHRNLQQSQPNHVEVVGEKNTLIGILRPITAVYNIPLTIGRGYCSIPPRYAMKQRFRKSGKEKLIVLIVSDFDPDGEEIANSFVKSLRDDFRIKQVEAVKVALTYQQVQSQDLPQAIQAKESSKNFKKFADKYGTDVYELESVHPETLQKWLREAIDSVLDLTAFNAELSAEKKDAAHLDGVRKRVHRVLGGLAS